MSIYRDKRTGRWMFEFDRYVGHQRIRRRKLLPEGWTQAKADAFDRAESAALYALASGLAKPRYYIGQAVERYVRERVPQLKHGDNVERELEATRDWWDGHPLEALPEVCAAYAEDQAGALAPATVKNRIAYLRSACRWCWKRHNWGDADPGARVVAPTVDNERDTTITRAQMVQLARACRHRGVRALIRILYYTGMRVNEAQQAIRAPGMFVLGTTKNGLPHAVPMLPIITSASRIKMPKRSEIDYYWPMARVACGLGHVHLHDLRHTAATDMVTAGIDLATVGAVLNHKSPASTKRYAHHGAGRLAEAMGKIGRGR